MSVELSTAVRDLVSRPARPVQRPAVGRPTWLAGLAIVAAIVAAVAISAASAGPISSLPWVLAALVAGAVWAAVARRSAHRVQAAFGLIALAAGLAFGAYLLWSVELSARPGRTVPLSAYLFVGTHLLLTGGIALCFDSRRPREAIPGLAADALLVLLGGLALVLRLVVEPLIALEGTAAGEVALITGLQTLGLLPAFAAAVLVLRGTGALAPRSAATLFAGTVALAAGPILSLSSLQSPPFTPGHALDSVWLGGWLLLALAAVGAREGASTAGTLVEGQRAYERLRRLLVPTTALFMAGAVIDLSIRPAPLPVTVAVLAALGVLLAFRTAQAFGLAERDAAQRRQIARTRALVEVSHALAGATQLDATLAVIAESSRSVLGTRAAGIEMIVEHGEMLETRAVVGLPRTILGLRFPIDGSFTGSVVRRGEPRATVDPSADPYIQPDSLPFLRRSPLAAAPIQFRGETLGVLFACIRSEPFDAEELDLMGAMAEQAAIAIQNARLFEQVTILSMTDPLTGLANRRQLEKDLEREFAAGRRGRTLVAVIFDLDDFKAYNDGFGHLAGDEALKAFARSLREETRSMNIAARYGGDEFVALLSDIRQEGAEVFVERVRAHFRDAAIALGHGEIHVSAGTATFSPGMMGPDALLRAADDDLYRRKARVRT